MRQCETCFQYKGHYHIIVEQGKVIEVWYISADGYWDRDVASDEYFVEYRDELNKAGAVRRRSVRSVPHASAGDRPQPSEPDTIDWLQPMIYKGSEDDEEEEYLS
jgi:hypothetical protein